MRKTKNDVDVDGLLAEMNPADRADVEDAVERVWRNRERPLEQKSTRRRWIMTAAVGVVALGVSPFAGPAVADSIRFLTQTGSFVTDESPEQEGIFGSEWLDTSRSDFREYARTLWQEEYVLPDGYEVDVVVDGLLDLVGKSPEPGIAVEVESIGVQRVYEIGARCLWYREWTNTIEGTKERSMAESVLLSSLEWLWTADQLGATDDFMRNVAANIQNGSIGAASSAEDCGIYLRAVEAGA